MRTSVDARNPGRARQPVCDHRRTCAKSYDWGHFVFLSRAIVVQKRCSRYGYRGVKVGEASNPGPPSEFDLTVVDSSDDEPSARRFGEVGAQFGRGARATNRATQPQSTGGNRFQALSDGGTESDTESIEGENQQESIRRPTRLRVMRNPAVEEVGAGSSLNREARAAIHLVRNLAGHFVNNDGHRSTCR